MQMKKPFFKIHFYRSTS